MTGFIDAAHDRARPHTVVVGATCESRLGDCKTSTQCSCAQGPCATHESSPQHSLRPAGHAKLSGNSGWKSSLLLTYRVRCTDLLLPALLQATDPALQLCVSAESTIFFYNRNTSQMPQAGEPILAFRLVLGQAPRRTQRVLTVEDNGWQRWLGRGGRCSRTRVVPYGR